MREQNIKWKMCGTRNPDFSRRKSFWSNQTLMREPSRFLSIDNFAKFDASCQLHLNPRKYQTWFFSCYSGWNKSISDGLRRHGDELRQENGVGEPLLQQRGLWTLRSGKGEKTFLNRRNKKLNLTSRCSSLCSCSSWSESSLLLQRSLWQTLPLSNPLGKNRSLLFFSRQNVNFGGCWRRTSKQ